MNISVWISVGALVVSITALVYSIRNGITKTKISILEMRNSLRVNVHESSMEVLVLIEKIKYQANSEQEHQIVEKLIETAEGMTSMYEILKKIIEVPWYISSSNLIKDYDRISSELKEFNLILSVAKAEFISGNIDKLERTVAGLHVRILGSIGVDQNNTQV